MISSTDRSLKAARIGSGVELRTFGSASAARQTYWRRSQTGAKECADAPMPAGVRGAWRRKRRCSARCNGGGANEGWFPLGCVDLFKVYARVPEANAGQVPIITVEQFRSIKMTNGTAPAPIVRITGRVRRRGSGRRRAGARVVAVCREAQLGQLIYS